MVRRRCALQTSDGCTDWPLRGAAAEAQPATGPSFGQYWARLWVAAAICAVSGGCVREVPGPEAFGSATADVIAGQDATPDAALGDSAGDALIPADAQADTADAGTVDAGDASDASDAPDVQADVQADVPDSQPECASAADCQKKAAACAVGSCGAGSCSFAAAKDGTNCDDGISCTKNDACAAGQCKGAVSTCGCLTDGDCAKQEDGNLCNGTLYCDQTVWACALNPATVVTCQSVDDTDCTKNTCDPKTGLCAAKAVKNNSACDDGNPCTAGDHCAAGECASSASTCACTQNSDCKVKEDGDLCNGTLYCDPVEGACELNPATIVKCPTAADTPCSQNTCNKLSGVCEMKAKDESAPCPTGNACTLASCVSGVCVASASTCNCVVDADCAKQDDGNACNGVLYCDPNDHKCKTNPATVITCKTVDDTACQKSTCDPKTGSCQLKLAANGIACDADGNPCTAGDSCVGGQCMAGAKVCPCVTAGDCAGLDDADACNGSLYCDGGLCVPNPATVIKCDATADTACSHNTCNPKSGKCALTPMPDQTACSDKNDCTVGDRCQAGSCVSGSNLCACAKDSDCLDDGDLCNGVPYCDTAGLPAKCTLKPGSPVACPATTDGCLTNQCQPKDGKCVLVAGTCDDKNPCTVDVCGAQTKQCASLPVIDGTPCGGAQVCVAGKCAAVPAEMLLIPSGKVWVGCDPALDKFCAAAEQPQHLVQLPSFLLDRYEVSVAEYAACVGSTDCTAAGTGAGCNAGVTGKSKHPINCVSWAQAKAFCVHVGKRLPSEAEWEMAARGACKDSDLACKAAVAPYPWGSAAANCYQTVMDDGLGPGCGKGSTLPCGQQFTDQSYTAVRDMGGNVSEWTEDGWDPAFYATSPASSPVAPAKSEHSVRGGNLASGPPGVRSAYRTGQVGTAQLPELGLRCAKDP